MRLGIYRRAIAPTVALNKMQPDKMSSNSRHPFFSYHLRAVLIAAMAFGLTHGVQIFILDFVRHPPFDLKPSALIILLLFETIQSLVFITIGVVVAYIPSRILEHVLRDAMAARRPAISVVTGVFLGILFLPLCAGFSYLVAHEIDSPSYLTRCAEYALPMVMAGVFGSYVFWRISFER